MRFTKVFFFLISMVTLSGCFGSFGFNTSTRSSLAENTRATSINVDKSARRLYLLDGKKVIRSYRIGLGFEPQGHKVQAGDGKTPEGLYYIDRKNPYSKYHLSLGISYPNTQDKAHSKRLGASPGGDIFIHGEDKTPQFWKRDWTAGCISVKDKDIREIYALVPVGTPILITPYTNPRNH